MGVVTLTTGWTDDFYVAAVKGILLSSHPTLQIVDMTHSVPAFNSGISHAVYIVKQSYHYFPKGTVHIISIASELTESAPFAAAYHNGHYFVGTDNGVFGLLFETAPDTMVRIEKFDDATSPNYPAISVFAPSAIHLLSGGDINDLGSPYVEYQRKGAILATMDESQITGTVIHINSFGNVVTNITRHDFEKTGKGRPFEILVQRSSNKITRINKYFHETSRGELLAVFNVSGYLEIAQNKGNIAEIFQLSLHSNIIVKFFNK